MTNFLQTAIQMMHSGRDPMKFIQNAAASDPKMSQAMGMMRGKSPQQLRQMAENMAAERGLSINDILRQLGVTQPSNR